MGTSTPEVRHTMGVGRAPGGGESQWRGNEMEKFPETPFGVHW